MTRRELLRRTGNGFGMLGLASLLAEKSEAAGALRIRDWSAGAGRSGFVT